ncbi:BgtA-20432 [Blumeria graminis f. sp. tritici]|uniref:DNA ligase n=2 Tax=Blumeria graminis f. sp. tritici TaxID=62690 RepID=A0A9X9QDC1_BLUGR|nr:hypothetical protein BGT96224_A20432 [Blumeria graminis f. sp. tritici 96224]VDB88986.1 BgtA-20432 [Blumeria graminis f. sp. tritici]
MAGKKRKAIGNNSNLGLDYYFRRQQHNVLLTESSTFPHGHREITNVPPKTDEEFARELQAKWNRENISTTCDKSKRVPDMNKKLPDYNLTDSDKFPQETDEEIARKLQAEWCQEEVVVNCNKSSKIPENLPSGSQPTGKEACLSEISSSYCDKDMGITPTSKNIIKSLSTEKERTLSIKLTENTADEEGSNIPFGESPLKFRPSNYKEELRNYSTTKGGNLSYSLLTKCFMLISGTSSRIKIIDTLVNLLRLLIEGDPNSLIPAVWLATNAISPPYQSLEIGLGGSAISKALRNVYGLDAKSLKTLYKKCGDAGDVAFEAKKRQKFTLKKPKPLTIIGVYQSLVQLAMAKGNGSNEFKQRIVDRLLQEARGAEESRYVLRIGAVRTTMLIALSRAFQLSCPTGVNFHLKSSQELSSMSKETLATFWSNGEELVKSCFAKQPNYNELVTHLLQVGVCDELIARCRLKLHIPILPMLGNVTRDITDVFLKLEGQPFSCEYKYDGQRAQVHCDDREVVSIFSRHLEIMTDKYPDLVSLIPSIKSSRVSSFILEGEVVAVCQSSGDIKSFQALSNRARKDVQIENITIQVCLFAFDLMFLNGQSLLEKSFRERRALLRNLFVEIPNQFTMVKSIDVMNQNVDQDMDQVLEFFKSATENKCEGIMVKLLDNKTDISSQDAYEESVSRKVVTNTTKEIVEARRPNLRKKNNRKDLLCTYEPDKRLNSWLKVKKDYSTTFDTLDLIPIAGWHGQGRKSKWWSPILFAVRNEETGSLEAVCKCISGFTDSFYAENKEFYRENGPNVLSSKPGYIEYSGGSPDVWFEPQEVFELTFADITLSPVYTASIGLVSDERGLSLRFPRFLKKRNDKSIDEASTSEFLAGLFKKQEKKSSARESEFKFDIVHNE